jgi:hypothetical protein
MEKSSTRRESEQNRDFIQDPPTTLREFKQAIEEAGRIVWTNACWLNSFLTNPDFLNETRLEALDGVAPMADPEHEKTRILIRECEDRMFRRCAEGMELAEAADCFQNDFRRQFSYNVKGQFRGRWDRPTRAVIEALAKIVALNLNPNAQSALTAFVKMVTTNADPEAKEMGDRLISHLYERSEALTTSGMVGFVDEADTLLGQLAAVAGVTEQTEDADETGSEFFDQNTEIQID